MNSLGSPLDVKYVNVEPEFVSMSGTHIVVSSQDNVYVWQYRN